MRKHGDAWALTFTECYDSALKSNVPLPRDGIPGFCPVFQVVPERSLNVWKGGEMLSGEQLNYLQIGWTPEQKITLRKARAPDEADCPDAHSVSPPPDSPRSDAGVVSVDRPVTPPSRSPYSDVSWVGSP